MRSRTVSGRNPRWHAPHDRESPRRQHALWTAETAKGGIRRQVGLRDQALDMHVRAEIGIVDADHRAHRDRRRKIGAPAAVGEQLHADRREQAVVAEADLVAGEERVPLAGHLHVDAARQLDAHRTTGCLGGECGDSRIRIGLGFLAAESATHAQAATDHAIRRQAQHPGHDDLGLGRMLRRGHDLDDALGIDLRPAGLGFEVEMVLATDRDFAVQRCVAAASAASALPRLTATGGRNQACWRIASASSRRASSGSRRTSTRAAAAAREASSTATTQATAAMELDAIARNQRFIMDDRAAVVLARNVGSREHGAHTRHRACGRDASMARMRACACGACTGNTLSMPSGEMLLVGVDGASADADGALVPADGCRLHDACSATNCGTDWRRGRVDGRRRHGGH
ncbi:MAG: hypothetical protein R3F08_14935 [Dokdonella sp.]